ncbi:MAG: zinc ribbon domain-containing protein [Bacteroidetes bacterium]|nr:FmdB family transcriptional regulator [Rhodothermaceae bacterium RA]RMH61492.1 MAG: zinc ribbon domain-containing protein [Bacteroidota bacterium]
MPTYVYRREDGTKFEIEQRITDAPLETCPTTGQRVTRVISGSAGLVFKGSGFYLTDYARNGNGNGKSASSDAAETSTKSENKTSASSTAGTASSTD